MLRGRELAVLDAPLVIENFEAIAVRRCADGETLLYLLSGDNCHALQRTLLLMSALEP